MQEKPASTLTDPVVTDFIAGVGDGVSYGITVKEGTIQLPLFSSSISIMLSSRYRQERIPGKALVSFDNYFIVGEGDAASILDTAYGIRGVNTGTLEGNVLDSISYQGVSHASVFVFKDQITGVAPQRASRWWLAVSESKGKLNDAALQSRNQRSHFTADPPNRLSKLGSWIRLDQKDRKAS